MTVLRAYLHKVKDTGNLHVKVLQPMPLGDAFAADMHTCGSPATWNFAKAEWDYPLTAACVLALQRVAEKHGHQVDWSEDLRQFADEQKRIDDYEQQIRMSMENIMRKNEPLPGYTTDVTRGAPMRHQMIAYHWGLRFTGLLMAWDPGTGKTRGAIDLTRGWYDLGTIRPMQQVWIPEAKLWGVRGGVLVVTKAAMVRTWALEFKQWQSMTASEIAGDRKRKLYKSAIPTHAHVINYESLKCVLHNQYDGIVVDECFVAGTKVNTPDGSTPIERLCVGDMVLAYSHKRDMVVARRVTHVFRNPRQSGLIRVTTSKRCFICTGNHPVHTQKGYTPAAEVVPGDVLNVLRSDPLCGVREAESSSYRQQGVSPPQSLLLRRMPHSEAGGLCAYGKDQTDIISTYEAEEPYEACRDQGEKLQHFERYETRTSYEGRKRTVGADGMGVVRRIEQDPSGLVYASSATDGQEARPTFRVEAGCVESVVNVGCGVGWGLASSSGAEGAGCSEGYILEGERVDCVEVYESGGEGQPTISSVSDHDCVFNLEVDEDHNYFAEGVLVHNCHSCANSSDQTENVMRLAQHTRRRLGLTGTPISNNLESAFFQMLIIDGGRALGPNKTRFLEEYFNPSDKGAQGHTKNIPKAGAIEAVSNRMARCTYFLKKEDALDLPAKTHTPIYLDMTDDQSRYYETLKKDYLVYIQDSQVSVQQAAARMMKLRQICQGFVLDDMNQPKDFSAAKVEHLIDMLKNKLTGRKVVIWAVFTHEINMLCQRLVDEQIGYVRLDGTVTSKKVRDQGLQLWNQNPAVQVFIGQIQMGVGITLHANECTVPCYDCVYLGIDYSFINWTQSQDRIHRIGQKYPCSYTYLLTDTGVDRSIYQSLLSKAGTSNAVYKAGKEFYASLVKGDEPNLAALDAAA
jgi:hypothetical protein